MAPSINTFSHPISFGFPCREVHPTPVPALRSFTLTRPNDLPPAPVEEPGTIGVLLGPQFFWLGMETIIGTWMMLISLLGAMGHHGTSN